MYVSCVPKHVYPIYISILLFSENNYILSMIMIGRCVGLLLLPTSVTALFKLYNPMILMYAVFGSTCIMLTMLLIAQFLATKFGVQGRLRVKSHKQAMHEDD